MSVVVKAKNAVIHNHLIGNTIFNDTEYEELLKITQQVSKDFLYGIAAHINPRNYEIVFITLIEITKHWKKNDTDDDIDESGFWSYIIKTVLGLEKGSTNFQKLYSEYTYIIQYFKRNTSMYVAKKGKKYYATLMMHSFSPAKSIHAFLDLCYNIYKKDLNFNYTENDKDICELATMRFCEILKKSVGNDKSISIGTNSYSVKIGLRTLALDNDTQKDFIDLLDEALKNINLLFYNQPINQQYYFEKTINDWWQDKQALIGIDRKTSYRLIPAVTKNKINVKFIRVDKIVYLVIPPIRLDNGISNTFHLFVYSNNTLEPKISEELFTIRGEFLDTTKQKDIDLNEFFQGNEEIKLRIEIKENDKKIYEANMKKEFILFENEIELSSNIIQTSNYFLYSRNIGSLKLPENIKTYAANLYNIYPKSGETINGIERQVYFQDEVNIINRNIISLIGNLTSCFWVFENKTYTVYNNQAIILIPNDTQLNGIELKFLDKKYLLSELQYRFEETSYLFDITQHLPKNEPLDILLYSHLKEKNLLKISIIVFNNFNLSFSKTAYYGNDEKKLAITFNNETYELHWNNKQNELIHPFQNGNLIIKLPYIKWRIDNNEWHNEPLSNKLWYKDAFHNGSFLQVNSDIKIDRIYVDNYFDRIMPNKITHNFDIGNFIYSNENKKDISFTFPVFDENKSLFTVSTKEHFYRSPLLYSNGKLYWCASDSFVGDEKRLFKLEIYRNKTDPVYFGELSAREDETIEIDDGIYQIIISSKENSIFTKENIIFYENEIIIGSKEKYRFANKSIKLLSASGELDKEEDISLFWKDFIPEYFIDQIEYINQNGDTYYLGKLYTILRKDGSKKYLNSLKNEKGEWERINPVRLDFVTNFEFEIVAGYNKDDEDDFLGTLIYDKASKFICNINVKAKERNRYCCLNRYRFNEVKNV